MRRATALAGALALTAAWLPAQAASDGCGQTPAEAQTPPATAVRPNAADFVVHLRPAVDPARVTVMYGLLNARGGGSGGYAVRDARVRIAPAAIAIDTTLEGQMAYAFTAVVYVRGFRFAFIDVPALANRRTADLTLIPLPAVPLSGRVVFGAQPGPGVHRLEIGYDASAMVKAFEDRARRRLSPVGGSSFASTWTPVASVSLPASGRFTTDVPDFLADPAVAATPGTFSLFMLDGTPLRLATGAAGPGSVGLPLARHYAPVELRIAP